ncbi:GNAT family N-acetyltransferase [Rosenbergiella epipactidis]|uniref:GNAT family N-acetyltransferase n=1 Tax=Rosenbergiella epipactidis TaxID=1544694 RepID=UPI001F4EA3D7|nr:GNAT family protein [Rosenbergiella epipactidis]
MRAKELPVDKIDSLRLEYRSLCDTDWPLFLALHVDRQVMTFISDPLDEETIRRHYFEPRLRPWQPGCKHWLCLIISEKTTGIPIGVTGFIERSDGIAEVGFILKPEFQEKGYGRESLKDIIQFALTHYHYHKLVATVTSGNEASRRTLVSAGFLQEGTLRKNYYLKGSWQDDWLFGLLREETG